MVMSKALATLLPCKSSISATSLVLVMPVLMALAGCTNDGAGGPIISSLSTPTDAAAELDSDHVSDSEEADHDGAGEDPIITITSTPTGITAHLTWDRPSDIDVTGYSVHYGKHSEESPSSDEPSLDGSSTEESASEEPDSCSRGEAQVAEGSSATITGLEPNTSYFFAIRAFNENDSESICSNEFVALTPPAES